MKAPAKVYIQNDQSKFMISPAVKKTIKEAVYATLIYLDFECPDTQVSVTLTDNEKIHEINLKHRQKDSPTDVLSFPMIDWENIEDGEELAPEGVPLMLGDIIISLEKAYEQAYTYGQTMLREIAFLTVHSTLHLLGYDHVNGEEEEKDMRARQTAIVEGMGLGVTEGDKK